MHRQPARAVGQRGRGEGGFTLIELLIVIVILGILAAIVVFSVSNITDKGDNSACQASVKTIEVAQESRFAKDGAYAGSVGQLVTEKWIKQAPKASYGIATDSTGAVTATGC